MPIDHVCPQCFGTAGLRRRIEKIRPNYPKESCSLHPSRKGVPIEAVAEIVDGVFRDNFALGEFSPHWGSGKGDDLQDTLYSLTEANDDQVIQALMAALEDGDDYWPGDGDDAFYGSDLTYVQSDHALETHSHLWDRFCEKIVYEQRFFNSEARTEIETIFSKIHLLRDSQGRPPIHTLHPARVNGVFYRARIANDDQTRSNIYNDTATHLGPPPQRLRRAGRMNAAGISAFYGAFEQSTAIAELRPAVGSVVAVTKFRLLQPVNVLDMTRFALPGKNGDVFSEDQIRRLGQYRFMQRFTDEIRKPIFASDEHLDYIPTQAVAEYLVHSHRYFFGGKQRGIDGIIYSSAQSKSGRNLVLFGNAALVESAKPSTMTRALGWADNEERLAVVPDSLNFHRITEARFGQVEYQYRPSISHLYEEDDDVPF
ncbi:RES domain-containing protein [Asticcacaulis sp.]|uniref:RES domain-containing protein n=1 Tax=Asticcacaulis sp. TaxID=1872648 RepID=UPI002D18C051|nr:RES domain-containing protein [Asticcacaulis sp.]HTM81941.1 RES domain-containing protein [Asticcacaulis sp.]